jgi:hypothetical protein
MLQRLVPRTVNATRKPLPKQVLPCLCEKKAGHREAVEIAGRIVLAHAHPDHLCVRPCQNTFQQQHRVRAGNRGDMKGDLLGAFFL